MEHKFSQFKFPINQVPLGIIEIMEIGVNMELNCELTKRVVSALQASGIKCYIVGGYVRDNLLGIESKDIDIELHNTTIEAAYQIVSQITEAKVFGKFGVISLTAAKTEFAIARTEQKSGTSHTDFAIDFITDGDLKLAASRRDFTINSIMYDLQTNRLIDNYGGIADLQAGILRHVSPAFSEDPLRVLRGLKFIARYDLQIAPETDLLCRELSSELIHLPKIRIQNELEAMFKSDDDGRAVRLLTEYLNLIFKQPLKAVGVESTSIEGNRLSLFLQFPDFKPVIEFCYEQKLLKTDLIAVLSNYQRYRDFEQLNGEERYKLLAISEHCLKYTKYINPQIEQYYQLYLKLIAKYNGNYFLERGISGKQIKQAMAKKIGAELNEL